MHIAVIDRPDDPVSLRLFQDNVLRQLRAMGVDESLAKGSVRFSLGSTNSEADIEEAARALKKILARRRAQDPDPCADGCDCCGE